MMDRKSKNQYRTFGKLFGYPDCCIEEFISCVADKNKDPFLRTKRIPRRMSNHTGFIPCSYCAWKILTKQCELKDLIKDRTFYKPFPQSEDD